MQPQTLCYLGLGSNLGDGQGNLQAAWRQIADFPATTTLQLSSPYRSSPVEMTSAFWFTNAVGAVRTALPAEELLERLLALEWEMGRRRQAGKDRTLDLDILTYGELLTATPTLTIPHPELHRRLFVLEPLAEIAPDFRHPVSATPIHELLQQRRRSAPGQQITRESWRQE